MHLTYCNKLSRLDESLRFLDSCLRLVSWKTDANGYITSLACERNNVMSHLQGSCLSEWRKFVHPEDLRTLLLAIEKATERRTMFIEGFHVVGSALKIRSFLVLGMPRFSANYELLGYSGTISDMTREEDTITAFNE